MAQQTIVCGYNRQLFPRCHSKGQVPVCLLGRVLHRPDHPAALEHPHHRQWILGLQVSERFSCGQRNLSNGIAKGLWLGLTENIRPLLNNTLIFLTYFRYKAQQESLKSASTAL